MSVKNIQQANDSHCTHLNESNSRREDLSVHCAQDPVTDNVKKKKWKFISLETRTRFKKKYTQYVILGGPERWPIS